MCTGWHNMHRFCDFEIRSGSCHDNAHASRACTVKLTMRTAFCRNAESTRRHPPARRNTLAKRISRNEATPSREARKSAVLMHRSLGLAWRRRGWRLGSVRCCTVSGADLGSASDNEAWPVLPAEGLRSLSAKKWARSGRTARPSASGTWAQCQRSVWNLLAWREAADVRRRSRNEGTAVVEHCKSAARTLVRRFAAARSSRQRNRGGSYAVSGKKLQCDGNRAI
jgi:hypothetical protein